MNKRLITLMVLGASAAFGWFLSASYVEREAFKQEQQTPEPTLNFTVPSSTESVSPSPAPDTVNPAPVEPVPPAIPPSIPPETQKPVVRESGGCYIGGCSSQLCSESTDLVSTCEWRESYACFATATCGRQASGTCGWTETAELKQCLTNPNTQAETEAELMMSM